MYNKKVTIFFLILLLIFSFCVIGLLYRVNSTTRKTSNAGMYYVYDRNGVILAYDSFIYTVKIPIKNIKYIDSKYKYHLENDYYIIDNKNLNLIDILALKKYTIITSKRKRSYLLSKNITTIGFSDSDKGIFKGTEINAQKSPVYTTIDIKVQNIIARECEKSKLEFDADECFCVAVNMQGEILGMHTTNSADPNNSKDFFNNITHGQFEFGSTCKIFTVFAGFYLNIFDDKTVIDTYTGSYIDNRKMHDVEPIPRYSDVTTIIKHSSNLGTVALAKAIGADNFYNILHLLRVTKHIKNRKFTTGDKITMSFGYFPTDVFSFLSAFLCFFNNGQLITPYLIKKTRNKINKISAPLSIFQQTIGVMRAAASKEYTLHKYNCVSKTGTAHRIKGYTYDKNSVNTFIVGCIPDSTGKYQIMILVGLLNPRKVQLAGLSVRLTLVNIVKSIAPLIQ